MGKRIIIFVVIAWFFTSCAVMKRDKTTTTSEKEKIEVVKDSSTNVKVNEEIKDAIATTVVDSGNEDINRRIDEILLKLNTSKSSGDNSYRFWYDAQLREIRAEFMVGQTKDSIVTANKDTKVERTFEEQVNEYIKKIVIPWWIYVIAIFLLRKQIIGVLSFFYPPIRGIQSLSDLATPPKRNQNP